MKAIILAAGIGSRIAEEIGRRPKSTLQINDKSLIQWTTEILLKKGMDVSICTGYMHEMIYKELKKYPVTDRKSVV